MSLNGAPWALRIGTIFAVAYILGEIRRRSGGLLAPMLSHFLFNFIGSSFFGFR